MADRYEISRGSEETIKKVSEESSFLQQEHVEKIEIKICFSATTSKWFVNIKGEDKEGNPDKDWVSVKQEIRHSSYTNNEIIYFDTRIQVEEWCKKKGLI